MTERTNVCSCCGKTFILDYLSKSYPLVKQMGEDGLCFECEFWKDMSRHRIPGLFIINGILSKVVLHRQLFYGKRWQNARVRFLRDMKTGAILYTVKKPLSLGEVPEPFKEVLADDYRWISYETYKRIKNRQSQCCMLKGCFDRYNCLWYNPEIAEPDGPWNKIPKSYRPGNELCESFINKNEMYNV